MKKTIDVLLAKLQGVQGKITGGDMAHKNAEKILALCM